MTVTKDPSPVARHTSNVRLMRWVVLIVAFALVVGAAGWLLMPDGTSGDSIPWRGQNHFSLHTP